MGHGDVMLLCDQEPAIRAVADRIAARWQNRALVRETARRSHQSLGGDERWNQSLQEEFRALRGQLEDDIGVELRPEMPVCAWLVRHAAWVLVRYQPQRARGGTTAYERIWSTPYRGKLARMCEQVLAYMTMVSTGKEPKRASKFRDRWVVGTWIGKAEDSDEHIVITTEGVARYRTIRRFPETDGRRWSALAVKDIVAVPWAPKAKVVQEGAEL
eukprot:8230444-Lingulodinium_polyedra.AAC.1